MKTQFGNPTSWWHGSVLVLSSEERYYIISPKQMDCAFYTFHFFEHWKHPGVYLWGCFGGLCSWTIFMGKPSCIEVQLMFWCGIIFECVLRWICLYLTFYMMHTILVILCVMGSSVLCSAMTRKTHGPWTQYVAREKSVYL